MVLACNVVELVAAPFFDAKEVFVAHWPSTILGLQLWRPFTAAAYLGPLSMHWATNLFFLVTYGSNLEAVNG